MNNDNPAARLYNILLEAHTHAIEDPYITVQQVWAKTFSLEEGDLLRIFYDLSLLEKLLDQVEKQIEAIPDIDHQIYLKRFGKIRELLACTKFNEYWSIAPFRDSTSIRQASRVTEDILTTLEFCSERLSRVCQERLPPDDEIEALRQAVESLKEQILSETLDAELQSLLLDLVESMRRALYEYRYWGIDSLRRELFTVLERLHRHYPVVQQNSDEPVVHSFWGILAKFDTLTSIYLNVPQILGGIKRLLGSG